MAQVLYRFQHPAAYARRWEQFPERFFKLMNNSVYGKTQENLRKRASVELVTDARVLRKRVITDNLTVIQCKSMTLTLY